MNSELSFLSIYNPLKPDSSHIKQIIKILDEGNPTKVDAVNKAISKQIESKSLKTAKVTKIPNLKNVNNVSDYNPTELLSTLPPATTWDNNGSLEYQYNGLFGPIYNYYWTIAENVFGLWILYSKDRFEVQYQGNQQYAIMNHTHQGVLLEGIVGNLTATQTSHTNYIGERHAFLQTAAQLTGMGISREVQSSRIVAMKALVSSNGKQISDF